MIINGKSAAAGALFVVKTSVVEVVGVTEKIASLPTDADPAS